MAKPRRKRMTICWSCGKPFPETKNPAGRPEQSRILVNCPEDRARRKRYTDTLYRERMKRRRKAHV